MAQEEAPGQAGRALSRLQEEVILDLNFKEQVVLSPGKVKESSSGRALQVKSWRQKREDLSGER